MHRSVKRRMLGLPTHGEYEPLSVLASRLGNLHNSSSSPPGTVLHDLADASRGTQDIESIRALTLYLDYSGDPVFERDVRAKAATAIAETGGTYARAVLDNALMWAHSDLIGPPMLGLLIMGGLRSFASIQVKMNERPPDNIAACLLALLGWGEFFGRLFAIVCVLPRCLSSSRQVRQVARQVILKLLGMRRADIHWELLGWRPPPPPPDRNEQGIDIDENV